MAVTPDRSPYIPVIVGGGTLAVQVDQAIGKIFSGTIVGIASVSRHMIPIGAHHVVQIVGMRHTHTMPAFMDSRSGDGSPGIAVRPVSGIIIGRPWFVTKLDIRLGDDAA